MAHPPQNISPHPLNTFGPHPYLMGIKGVGMAALAHLLQQAGLSVRGADVTAHFVTDESLLAAHIITDNLASATLPPNTTSVIYSGAHQGQKQRLVQDALAAKLPVFNLAQAVGQISQTKTTWAVCGVGGKSTTSAILAWILHEAGHNPAYAVGVGYIPNLGPAGHWSPRTPHFVVEADEYLADPQTDRTPRFHYLHPHDIIATSLTYDHPDAYASLDDTKAAFRHFFSLLPTDGQLVYNANNADLAELISSLDLGERAHGVGDNPQHNIYLHSWKVVDGIGQVQVGKLGLLECRVPGFHNLRNAAYAAVLAHFYGVDWATISQAVASFRSTPRRFELVGTTTTGALAYDDYAHHPHEIAAVIQTLQTWFPEKKVSIAFQPHTYSRTKALLPEFVATLAQHRGPVLILPIFASAREGADDSISSEHLVQALQARGREVLSMSGLGQLQEYISHLGADDLVITLGAGDVYQVYETLR